MSRNPLGTILALGIVGGLAYLYRDKLKTVVAQIAPGTPNLNFRVGSPTPGNVAGGAQPGVVNVPFAWSDQSGDMFNLLPPGYTRNSTGGISANPDPNGIGGGFAT